jgi:hypothetical protein
MPALAKTVTPTTDIAEDSESEWREQREWLAEPP